MKIIAVKYSKIYALLIDAVMLTMCGRNREGSSDRNECRLRRRLRPTSGLCSGQRGSYWSTTVPRRHLSAELSAKCVLQRDGTAGLAGVSVVQQEVLEFKGR